MNLYKGTNDTIQWRLYAWAQPYLPNFFCSSSNIKKKIKNLFLTFFPVTAVMGTVRRAKAWNFLWGEMKDIFLHPATSFGGQWYCKKQ